MTTDVSISAETAIDNTIDDPRHRAPLVLGGKDFAGVTEAVCGVWERKPPLAWYIAFAFSLSLLGIFGICLGYLVTTGVGVWGNNQPAAWGFGIVNFVFWVGIGHAGTLISAILFLLRQNWRTGINRFAEAMTIFAVVCAGIFPAVHVGRPWLAYWLFPIPNQMSIWPQFRSPLLWDVFAVSTYATVSMLFWYTGMVPDLASFRDRATSKTRQIIYGVLALGWRGSSRHWHRYERAYLLLAALATPLVLSVHSVVSFDFAVAQLPGWHATIFPPYFVAGAVFGGFAMVITLAIPARELFGLKDIITMRHLENMNRILLAMGLIVGYSYLTEAFTSWYSGNSYERFVMANRFFGPYAWAAWIMIFCNVVAPQFLWSKRLRTNVWAMLAVALCVDVGMWYERFVIIVTSLTRDFMPSAWAMFHPTWVDLFTLAGSFGLFLTLFLLFCRYLPMVAMAEVKTVMPAGAHPHSGTHGESQGDETRSDYWPDENERRNGAAQKSGSNDKTTLTLPSPGVPGEGSEEANGKGGNAMTTHAEDVADTPQTPVVVGVMGEFADVDSVVSAASKVRAAGFTHWDVHSPFPIHGIDDAMGTKPTILPWLVLGGGLVGMVSGLALQWFTNAFDYKFMVSGKPFFSLPAFIPIVFELAVLFAALTAVFGMFLLNLLPMLYNPLLKSKRFRRVTSDRFFIVIDAADPKFDEVKVADLMRELGATAVEKVED